MSAALPRREHDFVLGDLEEEFHAREARDGRARAVAWYLGEGVRSLWPLMTPSVNGSEGMMNGLGKDLRGGLRVFRRAPGFAAVVVATLAIGVGGATAVYSVVRGVLLTPLSFAEPDRVVMLWGHTAEYPRIPLTVGDHNVLVDEVEAFESVTGVWSNNALLLGDGEPEQIGLAWVTPGYFTTVGVSPALGRAPQREDGDAIVLSHGLWVRRYGADLGVLGRTVQVAGGSFHVVGVLPADRNPNLTNFGGTRAAYDAWRLMPHDWTQGDDRSVGWLRSTARLREGVSLAAAQAEVDALFTRVNETVTNRDGGEDLRVNLVPVREDLVGGLSRTLWILLAAVCGVLLIAATNVAHLLLGRGELRGGEVAVRAALGGSRARLLRQLLVETGVLATVGGVAGVGVAWIGVRALIAAAPPTLPRLDTVTIDGGVLLFATVATGVAAMLFGLLPAVRATRTDLARALGERNRTGGRTRRNLSRGLVVGEVALSLALLTATGLLLRSLAGLHGEDLGFDRTGVLTFSLEATDWGDSAESAAAVMQDYLGRLEEVPGVRAAAFTNRIPLGGGLFTGTYRSEEMGAADAPQVETSFRYVTPRYFETMGAHLLAGRSLMPGDGLDVAVLDQVAAERLWPGEDPVGRRVETSAIGEEGAWAEVVGVVAPMKHAGVAEPATETVFLPMLARAHQQNFRYVAVRVSGDPLGYVPALKEALRRVNANAVMARVRSLDDLYDQAVATTRFATSLLAVFGAVALLLATVGLHGVMAYTVRRRTREIGVRVALGADRREILRGAVGSGATLVVVGIVLGAALSVGLGGVLASLLHEVRPSDAVTLVAASVVMLAVGLLGAYLPARTVLAMDPVAALREE